MKKFLALLIVIILCGCSTEKTENIEKIEKVNTFGYDENGWNKEGWNRQKINKITNTKFDKDGYNFYGFNKQGINKITNTTLDEEGFDKDGWNEYSINKETGYNFDVNGMPKENNLLISQKKEFDKNYIEETESGDKKIYKTTVFSGLEKNLISTYEQYKNIKRECEKMKDYPGILASERLQLISLMEEYVEYVKNYVLMGVNMYWFDMKIEESKTEDKVLNVKLILSYIAPQKNGNRDIILKSGNQEIRIKNMKILRQEKLWLRDFFEETNLYIIQLEKNLTFKEREELAKLQINADGMQIDDRYVIPDAIPYMLGKNYSLRIK